MTTTNLDHQGHPSHEPAQTHIQNTPNLHTFSQSDTYSYHYHQQPQQISQPSTLAQQHPFINPFKMDADFWQQARGAPFGLHAALATNTHHSQVVHMQHHQQQQQQLQQHHHQSHHHLTEQTPAAQVHMSQNTGTLTQDDTAAMAEHQHHHHHQQQTLLHNHQQQQHNHINEEQQQPQDQQNQTNSQHLTHLGAEQSHHLLFNAAAAAAAAAHLSGVVKSNELTDATDKIVNNNNNNNNSNSNNNNSNENNEQITITKQEPHATNGLSGYVANNATNNNNNTHSNTKQVNEQQQITTSQHHKQQQQQHQQNPLKFEQQSSSPGSLPLEALQHQLQQQMQQQQQQQKHNKLPLRILNNNDTHNPENLQQHLHQQNHSHNLHQQQPPPATPSLNAIDNNSTQQTNQQHHQQVPTSGPLTPTSPLRISSLVHHHQTPTSSPQPSLTSPSGGSSTPDLKFSNDNNKLPNELQLQLSRSNSAAAISERTLEECWSTLQRLFMHKSAMQQMQQQIPRTGLGPTGTGGIGAESKPHQCQQCMKSFSSNHQLVQHIRVHTGEKPYKCSYCDRRFKQLSHVQQHTRLHTGERPYKCHLPDCGRAFIQLSNLQQHLRNHDAQVERAKNRPFHCNICGKGFATESSLRTHTSKELQLHLGVLQQHAALIGGPNATSCPICHKLFLGTDSLMEHMKNVHKEKSSQSNTNPFAESICGSTGNNLSNAGSTSCLQSSGASSSNDPYSAKRRTANHPCPVCGKHYVNEGSLRKHLACHAETSQLTNSLRMWPCSVCQAVFTYENGLLTHMEHMRMDPKHQFAAQYVLSRAAAERRDRDNILAATLAASSGSSGGGIMPLLGEGTTAGVGGSNSQCPSPSANSECSSNGRLSSSAASDPGSGINLLNSNNNNNNNTNNNNNNNNNHINNNNCNNSNSNLSLSNKLNDILRTGGNNTNHPLCAPPHSHTHVHNPHQNHAHTISGHGYGSMTNVDPDLQNRMSLMAAASAAAAAVAASANNTSVAGLPSPQRFGVDTTHPSGNAAVQAAVVNLAAAMRLNQTSGSNSAAAGGTTNESALDTNLQQTQNQGQSNNTQNHSNGRTLSPVHPGLQADASAAVMNAMRDSMMRSSMMETSSQESSLHQHQQQMQQQHQSSGHTSYAHVTNTNITHTASHHHTQQQPAQHLQHLHQQPNPTASGTSSLQHLHQQHNHTANNPLQTSAPPPSSHSPDSALHMQQQAEAILRSHTEVAFRLAASVAQQQNTEISPNNNNNNNNNDKLEQTQQQQQQQQAKNSLTEDNSQQKIHLNQNTQDISEVIRLQEHRLEQALRLHNDARNFNFLNTPATQQQPNNTTSNHNNTTTSNTTTQPPPQQHHHTT